VLVELDRVGRLVRAAARDDLRAAAGDLFADLDQPDLLGVGERGGLAGRARDDDAVGAVVDHVVDVLLDPGPIDLAVSRERRDERDEHLSEGVV
jgi:hypothetical protein